MCQKSQVIIGPKMKRKHRKYVVLIFQNLFMLLHPLKQKYTTYRQWDFRKDISVCLTVVGVEELTFTP